jgi:NAD+ kinase
MTAQYTSRRRVAFDPKPFRNQSGGLRVLLVHKKSRLELQKLELSAATGDIADEHIQHLQCMSFVEKTLLANGADVEECFRDDLLAAETVGRVIVTVGGDGTVLDASRCSTTSPILGVNSDPKRSVGSLCVGTKDNFDALFTEILQGEREVLAVTRITGTLNGKDLGVFALNEILVAHQNPAAMSRYAIEVGGTTEEHKSSGVWVSTAVGSTGAILSAGGHIQPLDDSRLQYVVREPYFSLGKVGMRYAGVIADGDELTLTSRMVDGKIFFDGPHCTRPFSTGSKLTLHSKAMPLFLFVSEEMEYRRRQIAELRASTI